MHIGLIAIVIIVWWYSRRQKARLNAYEAELNRKHRAEIEAAREEEREAAHWH